MPASQQNRQISVKSALAADVLLFSSMNTSEQLGRLPEFRVQMQSMESDIKIADVLGKPMTVEMELAGGETRHFHGIVTRFCSTGWSGEYSLYEAVVHPWLWLLKKSSNCRIFQNKTVPEIVKDVCAVYGGQVSLSDTALTGDYKALDYCVQYRETDFDFVCRLLEDVGIYFYFTYTADSHKMVLADSYNTHEDISGYSALKFATASGSGGLTEESVSQWNASGEIQSSSYALNDYNFEKSAGSVSGGMKTISTIKAGFEQTEYEMYDYPGSYVVPADGNALAKARLERLHGQCEVIDARTDARGLYAGGLFSLVDHPRDDQNRKYLITGTRLQVKGGDYTSGGVADTNVECRFTAIGHTFPYRPSAVIAKPIVQGPQTAMVVGKAGEEIWTDEYGRIKVQFHWDRLGKEDEKSSCWVRVSQTWAGKGWGAMTVPRIGMEVIVSFLEGDPDRPLVTGCVYNSDAMPPYPLPANQTRSTFKTNSSKGGGGFNELRFEDKKGAEEIFIQAERDCNRIVKNNDTLKVGYEVAKEGNQTIEIKNDQKNVVGHDQVQTVGNDQKNDVTHDQIETVGNNLTLSVGVDQEITVGGKEVVSIGSTQTIDVGTDQSIKAGATIKVEANTSIELICGSSSIKIEPAKITIKTTQLEIKASATAKIEAGATMDVKAGAVMTIEGVMVKIN